MRTTPPNSFSRRQRDRRTRFRGDLAWRGAWFFLLLAWYKETLAKVEDVAGRKDVARMHWGRHETWMRVAASRGA